MRPPPKQTLRLVRITQPSWPVIPLVKADWAILFLLKLGIDDASYASATSRLVKLTDMRSCRKPDIPRTTPDGGRAVTNLRPADMSAPGDWPPLVRNGRAARAYGSVVGASPSHGRRSRCTDDSDPRLQRAFQLEVATLHIVTVSSQTS